MEYGKDRHFFWPFFHRPTFALLTDLYSGTVPQQDDLGHFTAVIIQTKKSLGRINRNLQRIHECKRDCGGYKNSHSQSGLMRMRIKGRLVALRK
jgi:hypothetical protein